MEIWYLIQPSLQFLLLRFKIGISFWVIFGWCALWDFSLWFLLDEDLGFVPLSFCFWLRKWPISVLMLAEPFFFTDLLLESRKCLCSLANTPINSKLLCISRLLLSPDPWFSDKSCDALFFLKTSGLVFHQNLCFHYNKTKKKEPKGNTTSWAHPVSGCLMWQAWRGSFFPS